MINFWAQLSRKYTFVNFVQDLDEDDIMVLDSGDEIYVWVGNKSSSEERQLGMKMAEVWKYWWSAGFLTVSDSLFRVFPSVGGYKLLQELHALTHASEWLFFWWYLACLLSLRKKSQAAILTYCILPSSPCNAATLVSDFLPTVHQAVCLFSCVCMGDTSLKLRTN